jgi:hypothetical protein
VKSASTPTYGSGSTKTFNPEEIKQLISMAIDEYEIPPPMKTLSIQGRRAR